MHWWDLGNWDRIKPIWRQHAQDAVAVIFVLDASDLGCFKEAREELATALGAAKLRKRCRVVVAANKQDLPGALQSTKLAAALELKSLCCKDVRIVETCASSGFGIQELLDSAGVTVASESVLLRRLPTLLSSGSGANTCFDNVLSQNSGDSTRSPCKGSCPWSFTKPRSPSAGFSVSSSVESKQQSPPTLNGDDSPFSGGLRTERSRSKLRGLSRSFSSSSLTSSIQRWRRGSGSSSLLP